MRRRSRRPQAHRGFTLLEAVIVIAIMAILASAATPLLMRALTQQRAQRTRDAARAAYEALVGARERSVPNLVTDVGFVPPATLADLRFLTTINPAAAFRNGPVPPAYPSVATGFTWGWQGPYWTAPIQSLVGTNGLPADGWGRPFRWQVNQVQSAGADGVFGNGDDVAYPPAPAAAPALAQVQVTLERQLPPPAGPLPPPETFTVQIMDRSQQQLRTRTAGTFTFTGSGTGTTAPLTALPGAVLIQVTSAVGNQSQTATLAPGETRVILFRTNL
ncbi:MAG: type II secretion system protein [Geothrix sp.]|nr:type II secretion system protein [Geothrix sp.]